MPEENAISTEDLADSLAQFQQFCADPTLIADGKTFLAAYDKIKEAVEDYLRANPSRYITEMLPHLPVIKEEEITPLIEDARERMGTNGYLPFVKKEIAAVDMVEPFKTLFFIVERIIFVILHPGVEEQYYDIKANPNATVISVDCMEEGFYKRVLRDYKFTFLNLFMLVILSFLFSGSLNIHDAWLVWTFLIALWCYAYAKSLSETRYALIKLTGTPSGLNIKYKDRNDAEELQLNWEGVEIFVRDGTRGEMWRYIGRYRKSKLQVQKEGKIVFTLLAHSNKEFDNRALIELADNLNTLKQAVDLVGEDE